MYACLDLHVCLHCMTRNNNRISRTRLFLRAQKYIASKCDRMLSLLKWQSGICIQMPICQSDKQSFDINLWQIRLCRADLWQMRKTLHQTPKRPKNPPEGQQKGQQDLCRVSPVPSATIIRHSIRITFGSFMIYKIVVQNPNALEWLAAMYAH